MSNQNNNRYEVVGAVLAGGTSRRYGKEKSLLKINGKIFIRLAVERLKRFFPDVFISVDRKGRFEKLNLAPEIEDCEAGGGACVGILSALQKNKNKAVFIMPVDMPLVPDSVIKRILETRTKTVKKATILKVRGRYQPLMGIYEPDSAPIIQKCLMEDKRRVVHITKKLNPEKVYPLAGELPLLININTPTDYLKALRILNTGTTGTNISTNLASAQT